MKKLMSGIALTAAVYIFISCAFPFQSPEQVELSDISDQLGYNEISRKAFIGGSVLYNPDQPSIGTLSAGVHLAVRLGRVDIEESISGQPDFSDRAADARYGFITIDSISASHISFTYTQYEEEDRHTYSSFSLFLNETADLNRDGYPDVTYAEPVRKRPGMEKAVYLTFLSSQETLNTAMFAVLPEQYSRGVYPSGIIGINPDGRFIVTKYECENSTVRAAVQGVVYGDYVLDYYTGTYQKVIGQGQYRSARSIDDSDLSNTGSMENLDAYFLIQEFDDVFLAENLFNALPETIQDRFDKGKRTNEEFISVLNTILESYDLIESVAAVKDVDITEAELLEISTGIRSMEMKDIVLINRLFLSESYPEECPAVQNSDDVAFIFPLLHCVIRGDGEDVSDNNSRGVTNTYTGYIQKRNALRSQFSNYHSMGSVEMALPSPLDKTANRISFGIYGVIENNWMKSIKLGISAAAFLQLENAQFSLSENYKKENLLAKSLGKSLAIANFSGVGFWIGPVYISLDCPLNFDIDLEVGGNLNFSTPLFIGFTGLYGAGAYVGANYGITWKKVWFIEVPVLYFNPYIRGESVSDFAFYAGPIENSITPLLSGVGVVLTNASAYAAVTPKLIINPSVSVWKLVSAGLAMDTGLQGRFTISALPHAAELIKQNKLPIKGIASLHFLVNVYGTGRVGLEPINILGIKINFPQYFKNFPILQSSTKVGDDLVVF